MASDLLRLRARLNRCLRAFFDDAGFVEVETPLLAPWLIPEPSIEVFATEQRRGHGRGGWRRGGSDGSGGSGGGQVVRPLYLTPSPELWMKRLVAAGMPRVYQLARCFRNLEEEGPDHRHEFTMLEWYATDESHRAALGRMERLLAALHAELARWREPAAGTQPPLLTRTMDCLWREAVGVDPARASAARLLDVARRLQLPAAAGDSWEELFHRIFLARVEPLIPADRPTAVLDYPARIPTLAATAEDGVHALRWELYLGGTEIANCFQEETDAARLQALFAAESRRQSGSGAAVVPRPDPELAVRFGPVAACAGVAVGVDRLYARLLGLPGIAPLMACTDFW